MKLKLISIAALCAMAGSAQAQISDNVVKIGVLNDMSGLYSDIGGPGSLWAAKAAVEDYVKATGSKLKIEVIGADHQNKPDVGSNIARMELRVALQVWMERFSSFRLDPSAPVTHGGVALDHAVGEVSGCADRGGVLEDVEVVVEVGDVGPLHAVQLVHLHHALVMAVVAAQQVEVDLHGRLDVLVGAVDVPQPPRVEHEQAAEDHHRGARDAAARARHLWCRGVHVHALAAGRGRRRGLADRRAGAVGPGDD